jgi:ribosome maturation factor RimP
VSAVLDVEDPIKGEYNLEVSSPGLDRPLFRLEQFEKFVGHQCSIRMKSPIEGQRKFTGVIRSVENDSVILDLSDKTATLPFGLMDKANLVPEF